jgi:hypothetical protein
LAFALVAAFVSACSGGGGSPHVTTPASPSPSSTATGSGNEAAFQCPTSDAAPAGIARNSGARTGEATRYAARGGARNAAAIAGRVAVTYDLRTLSASRTTFAARESASGATFVKEFDFPHTSLATRVLTVPAAQQASIMSKLRMQQGVRSVAATGGVRYPQAVTVPYYPSDPYFDGFTAAQNNGNPATYETLPFVENANVPGQWNEHVIGLEHAFAYSQAGNGSTVPANANALGLASVKVAIIDTGEDTTQPELASKITYQKCFITDPSGNQSTSSFTTDEDGHGTDVSGLAAADTNNALGFSSPGGNTSIYGYRVQPTPDDNCTSDTTSDPQCLASTNDIASAILDAVAQKVNVISLSLGGGSCTNGVDPDTVEGQAITEALAANIVIVASSGNDGKQTLEAPACDTGVIAAGATSLADGQLNGTQTSSGSAASPNEYVASYSDYGTPGAAVKSATAWGIVAPGGDPSSASDSDDLHWIEDIWTTTPFDTKNFGGNCTPDYPGTGSVIDCRTLIAGTSMSAPTVAGSIALVLAVNPSYQSPTKMKTLLCSTADDIVDPKEGCGRLNVYRAVAVAIGDPTPP